MRRRTGLLEDLLELGARLPWGISVTLAAAAYVLFHIAASPVLAHPTNASELGAFAGRQVLSTIASFLQYIAPLACLLSAAGSFARRRRNGILLADAADSTRSISDLSWQDFERLVGANFERDGFAVTHTGGGGADGGVDLVLTKGRESTFVQCKQWRAQKVGVTTVRELYGVMAARGAAHGIVVSAGAFTPDARAFATGRNIDLVNGRALAAILGSSAADDARRPAEAPACPKCGSRMLQRVARKGASAGQAFWGCETFPRCRVTLPII
jgi:restriction system protein